jgi:dihydrofolate synthase/folylpolyglutamate synthase
MDVPLEALRVLQGIASRQNPSCDLIFPDAISGAMNPSLEGDHQRRNAALVLTALRILKEKDFVNASDEEVRRGLQQISWPGRLETISAKPWILLDGAHNPEAMRVVHDYLAPRRGGRRLHVVFATMADKNYVSVFKEISAIADEVLLTRVALKRCAAPETVAISIAENFQTPKIFSDVEAVFEYIQKIPKNDIVLVTGSFFLVGEFRKLQKSQL